MADWADGLTDSLLVDVFERLSTEDSARFRAVCTSWNSAPAAGGGLRQSRAPPELPWLLLSSGGDGEAFRFVRPFSPRADPLTVHRYSRPPPSEFRWTRCVGSSPDSRWLAVLDAGGQMHVLEPIRGARARLPPLPSLAPCSLGGRAPVTSTTEVRKAAVSPSDAADAVVVMAIFVEHPNRRARPAVARAGDERWTLLEYAASPVEQISDVLFHTGKFYAVSFGDTRVLVCDVDDPPTAPRVAVVQPVWEARLPGWLPRMPETLPLAPFLGSGHLVGLSTGELALVQFHPADDGQGLQFCVLKLELLPGPEGMRWIDAASLGDDVVLLSSSCSMAMSTGEFPADQALLIKRNCIYCVRRDSESGVHKMQVHSLEDGSSEIRSLCEGEEWSLSRHPPTWFVPNKVSA